MRSSIIQQIVVVGLDKRRLGAIIVPNSEEVLKVAGELSIIDSISSDVVSEKNVLNLIYKEPKPPDIDRIPPTTYVTTSTSFTSSLNVSVNISFCGPCIGEGFRCQSVNACNLLVYGAGQVIPSFFRIMILLQSSLEFFEQWDPGGHLDVWTRDRSSYFVWMRQYPSI